ncbi:MAG: folylpolyglutamate synthase/dihydrofolate synthase family protein [Pseudomonadota bacterium]
MAKKHLSYKEAVDYLYGLQKYGIKFGLSKTSNLLKAFGNPQRGRRFIHIAGSNGKGSVAAMLESILVTSGLKVGFYLSPHLVRFTERFRINGAEIARDRVARLTGELMKVIRPEEPPTFFEAATAMALLYFDEEGVDIAIMEVGMGGRLDATNVIRPAVSVITNISMEHREFLGNRLLDIAGEKGGIIKKGVDLVTAAAQPAVIGLFKALCEKKGAPFWRVGRDMRIRSFGSGLNYYGLDRTLRGLELALEGNHQKRNAATALGVIELLKRKGVDVSDADILEGLKKASWPGRMQVASQSPLTILDGAHNPGAMRELAASLRRRFGHKRLVLVLGIMADKDIKSVTRGIVPLADYVIYTRPQYYRAAEPGILMRAAEPLGTPGEIVLPLSEAVGRARGMAGPEGLVLITGSLFTVGEALSFLEPEKFRPDEGGVG